MPKDEKEFNEKALVTLKQAAADLYYLLNHGYSSQSAVTFVGNHYLLTSRQRSALQRTIFQTSKLELRKNKELSHCKGLTLHIDTFNTIITLEVALSSGLLLQSMDGTFKDLAGIHGTYKAIDKTDAVMSLIRDFFNEHGIKKAVFYIDSPVSNSGKLKQKIEQDLAEFDITCINIPEVDKTLYDLENVVTSDAIILDNCKSFVNMNRMIIEKHQYRFVDLYTHTER